MVTISGAKTSEKLAEVHTARNIKNKARKQLPYEKLQEGAVRFF